MVPLLHKSDLAVIIHTFRLTFKTFYFRLLCVCVVKMPFAKGLRHIIKTEGIGGVYQGVSKR